MAEGAFKVFVGLHVADFASRHLLHFSNIAAQAGQGVEAINKKLMLMGGLASMMVGGAVVGAMVSLTKHSVEAATELENVERRLKSIGGITPPIFNSVSSQAWALGNRFTNSTQAERLQIFGDLHTVFGSPEEAKRMLPLAMQFRNALKGVNPETGEREFFSAFKAAELSVKAKPGSIMSPEAFEHRLDLFAKIYSGTMGRVTPSDMLAFMKQAKYSRYNLTDDALYKTAEFIFENKGSVAGSAYQALARVAGGKLGNSSSGAMYAHEWEKMGLITNITERSKQGNPKRFDVVGRDLLYSDPNLWAETVFMPAMLKKGYDLNKNSSAYIAQLTRMFGNQTAGNAVFTFLQQQGIINKGAQVTKNSKGIQALSELYDHSYAKGFESLRDSLTDLFAVVGKALVPVIVPGLKMFTGVIRELTNFAKNHQKIAALMVVMLALGGAIVVVGGAFATLFALFTPIALALAGITVGIVGTIVQIYALVRSFDAIIKKCPWVVKAFQDMMNGIIGAIKIAAGMAVSIAGGLSLQKGLVEAGLKLGKDGMQQAGLAKPTATPSGNTVSQAHVTIHINGAKSPEDTAKAVANVIPRAINPTAGFLSSKTHRVKHGYA